MNRRSLARVAAASTLLALCTSRAGTAQHSIDWFTVDGGGARVSAGGAYEVAGTIGQPDASPTSMPMSGGAFELVGGFWPALTDVCACRGDMNGDGIKDGRDIQRFVNCLVAGGACSCADVDAADGVTLNDIPVFVTDLLGGSGCP